jgi:hypothetical protein
VTAIYNPQDLLNAVGVRNNGTGKDVRNGRAATRVDTNQHGGILRGKEGRAKIERVIASREVRLEYSGTRSTLHGNGASAGWGAKKGDLYLSDQVMNASTRGGNGDSASGLTGGKEPIWASKQAKLGR